MRYVSLVVRDFGDETQHRDANEYSETDRLDANEYSETDRLDANKIDRLVSYHSHAFVRPSGGSVSSRSHSSVPPG
jgi:hypothetical protein